MYDYRCIVRIRRHTYYSSVYPSPTLFSIFRHPLYMNLKWRMFYLSGNETSNPILGCIITGDYITLPLLKTHKQVTIPVLYAGIWKRRRGSSSSFKTLPSPNMLKPSGNIFHYVSIITFQTVPPNLYCVFSFPRTLTS